MRRKGHGKRTTGTTPQRSTREGETTGADEGQHNAPQHAPHRHAPASTQKPHRHHKHRTHPHPRPQHVDSGPRQPAWRAGSRERQSARTRTPLATVEGPPPLGRPPTTPAARSPPQGMQAEKFIVFSALCFASPADCCWCRVSCCLFLEMKSFVLMKYSHSKSLQDSPSQ